MLATPAKKSAMHHKQLANGAQMVERDGWLQACHYSIHQSSPGEESLLLQESCGIFDISPTGKLLLQGEELGGFLGRVLGAGAAMQPGEVLRVSSPGDGLLSLLAPDECLVLCSSQEAPEWLAALPEGAASCLHWLDRTSGLAGVRLTGPKAEQLLSKLTELDVSPESFPDLRCAQTRCAEIHGTLVRADLGTLPSYDLYFPRDFGEYMWDAVLESGEELGAGPVGLDAMKRLQT